MEENKPSWNIKKIIFIVVALVIVTEVVWAVYSLRKPASKIDQPELVAEKEVRAKLNFTGPQTATQGANFKVDVVLSTFKPTGGADLILKYDPKMLELVPNNKQAINLGKIYQEYPVNEVDSKEGKITLTGLTSLSSKGFVGEGLLLTINFKAKTKGSTKISFDFTKRSTTDSNISEEGSGVDLLDEVSEYTINID